MDTILTLEEVAAYLRVSERTVKEWATSGELPGGKLGASWRFRRGDIEEWVAKQLTPHKHSIGGTSALSLKTLIDPSRIFLLSATTKAEALNKLIDEGTAVPGVTGRPELADAIFKREELMSTGIGLSLAVPHARLNGVDGVYTVIGICEEGLTDYETLDGQPVKIIILFIAGRNQHTDYVRALSLFSGRLKQPLIREQLYNASDRDEIYNIITED